MPSPSPSPRPGGPFRRTPRPPNHSADGASWQPSRAPVSNRPETAFRRPPKTGLEGVSAIYHPPLLFGVLIYYRTAPLKSRSPYVRLNSRDPGLPGAHPRRHPAHAPGDRSRPTASTASSPLLNAGLSSSPTLTPAGSHQAESPNHPPGWHAISAGLPNVWLTPVCG